MSVPIRRKNESKSVQIRRICVNGVWFAVSAVEFVGQSNLVGTYIHCLWQISGNVKPLSGSIWTRTATTCIIYGRFSALFGRPFRTALSANQILSAPTCISYGRFPALFGGRFFCSIETLREPRRFTIAPSFEIVLTSQTIISKRAT